jgi:hypothetical protein
MLTVSSIGRAELENYSKDVNQPNDIHWNLPTFMVSETQDIQGILDKHYTKGSFSHLKKGPCYYRTNQLEI